jgi:hypothetical protein
MFCSPHARSNNGHSSQTGWRLISIIPSMTPEALTRTVKDFLSDLMGYISPEIDWEFVGIDERWREGLRVVFGSASKTIPLSLAG